MNYRNALCIVILLSRPSLSLSAMAASPPAAQGDRRVLAAVETCGPGSRTLLEQVVAIDSGTGDAEGLARVGALYAARLREIGGAVRLLPSKAPAVGDNIVATFTGSGKGRILLIAHMDTVFTQGAVARTPPHWQGDHLIGPGAGDDKSGGVMAICALSALKATGFRDFARIDLVLNASEETGSLGSRDLILELSRASDAAINLERGIPSDTALVGRKGSAVLVFELTGVAAHSGLEPEKGRNAALAAARVALALGALADASRETTVNVTQLASGEKTNIIPDHAVVKADVRAYTNAEFDRIEQAAARIAAQPVVEGVTMISRLERGFPPWPHVASTDAMLARANRLYAELGRSLKAVSVGSSADVALAAMAGIPVIDAFGMEGGGAHGVDDYVDFATLTPRAYLLARMLMDLGQNPPAH